MSRLMSRKLGVSRNLAEPIHKKAAGLYGTLRLVFSFRVFNPR